jgi:hypothetical protein
MLKARSISYTIRTVPRLLLFTFLRASLPSLLSRCTNTNLTTLVRLYALKLILSSAVTARIVTSSVKLTLLLLTLLPLRFYSLS